MSLMRWASGTSRATAISSRLATISGMIGGAVIGEDAGIDRREDGDQQRHGIDDVQPPAHGPRIAGGAELDEAGQRTQPGEEMALGHAWYSTGGPGVPELGAEVAVDQWRQIYWISAVAGMTTRDEVTRTGLPAAPG